MRTADPAACPKCGSRRVAAILHADHPADQQSREDLALRRAILSGRGATGNDPRWHCLECHLEWGHPRGLSGSTAGSKDLA